MGVYVLVAGHGDARTRLPEQTQTTISRSEGLGYYLGVLNRRVLPEICKLKGWRLPAMIVTAAFFLFFSGLLIFYLIVAPGEVL
jgi:hypothetical protein